MLGGRWCANPNLKIDGYPTFNLYKDGIFIEQWGGGDHDLLIEGFAFALFVSLVRSSQGLESP